jgi:hypothetical protein
MAPHSIRRLNALYKDIADDEIDVHFLYALEESLALSLSPVIRLS